MHAGIMVAVSDAISVQAGFFTQQFPAEVVSDLWAENFLTAGVRWTMTNRVVLSANVIDSHITNPSSGSFGDRFRPSSVSLGLGYALKED
jgi:hypothetical protein